MTSFSLLASSPTSLGSATSSSSSAPRDGATVQANSNATEKVFANLNRADETDLEFICEIPVETPVICSHAPSYQATGRFRVAISTGRAADMMT